MNIGLASRDWMRLVQSTAAETREETAAPRWVGRLSAVGPVLVVAVQLGVLLVCFHIFAIEEDGFLRLAPLLLGGFVLNAVLPLRYRLPFFFALSVGGLAILWGWGVIIIVAVGAVLIGIVHLPIPTVPKIALLICAAAAFAAMATGVGSLAAVNQVSAVAPVVGSIFMFRLAIYFYENHHDKTATSVWHRLSYFFMLPNAAFFLFPVIDYRHFRTLYYSREPTIIYQRGVSLIFRGFVQLLVYRLLYYYLVPNPTGVIDLTSLATFMIGGYLLYVKIVALFHIITGSLALFGFDLPSSHHHYLFASGFNDLWRRARMDWKDFMMKLFYYPMIIAFKHRGITTVVAIIVATTVVFFISWLLHSYQWFWLLGSFPIKVTDFVFWTGLGALVVANSLIQLRSPHTRRPDNRVTFWEAFVHASKVAGVLVVISLLWSFWYSSSPSDWLTLMSHAESNTASGILTIAGLALALMVGAAAWRAFMPQGVFFNLTDDTRPTAAKAVILVGSLSLLAAGLSAPAVVGRGGDLATIIGSLRVERLTTYDQVQAELGYYDTLTRQNMSPLTAMDSQQAPADWVGLGHSDGLAVHVDNILGWRIRPSVSGIYKRAYFQSDSWGLRDKEYDLVPPPGTFRAALMGSSYEMGDGVANNEVFEAIAESRLNAEFADHENTFSNYEILNFAASGQTAAEHLARMDEVLQFQPNLFIYTGHVYDDQKVADLLAAYYGPNDEPLPDYLSAIVADAGIDPNERRAELRADLRPHGFDILAAIYREIVQKCRDAGVLPIWVLIPAPLTRPPTRISRPL